MEENYVPTKLSLSVVASCLVSFCGLITETATNIAFPAVMKTFSVSTGTVQWLTTGNLLVVAMITPLSAFLQRRFKLRHLLLFATLCFIIGTVMAAVSPNFAILLLARLVQGVGTGVGVPIAFCIILIMLTFLCLVYGFANIGYFGAQPLGEIVVFVVGIAALLLFAKHCAKCEHPLIDVAIFRNIPFVCHLIAFFLINAIMLGISFLLPNYLQVTLLCASMMAGLMLLPGAGLNALMGPLSGAALDKIGAKLTILVGTGLMTIGTALFALFGMRLNTEMIIGFYILFGVGCGIAFGNTMTIGNLRLPVQQKAYGNTCFNTLMQFAGVTSTSICAALVSAAQGRNNGLGCEIRTVVGSTQGFIFLLVLAVICLILQIVGFRVYEDR